MDEFVSAHSKSVSCEQLFSILLLQDTNDTFLMDVVNVLTCELCWTKRQSLSLKRRNLIVKYSMHHLNGKCKRKVPLHKF